MTMHDASASLLGYLYQLHYALMIVLEDDDPECRVVIEKFDDIATKRDGKIDSLVQLKHHGEGQGSLTDRSVDLWRTISAWLDLASGNLDTAEHLRFVIATTAVAPEGTVASLLRPGADRVGSEEVYGILYSVAEEEGNKANSSYYKKFRTTDKNKVLSVLDRMYVLDEQPAIAQCEGRIMNRLRLTCSPRNREDVYNRLVGYWDRACMTFLDKGTPPLPAQYEVDARIRSWAMEYAEDNLPIEIEDDQVEACMGPMDQNLPFCRQLSLIHVGERRALGVRRDFYRASLQRASWIKNADLLFPDELDKYDDTLVEEWSRLFAIMEDDMRGEDREAKKIQAGRKLLSDVESLSIHIRPKCVSPFIMRGSFHKLANDLRVGWHIDYYPRLVDGGEAVDGEGA